MYKKASIDDAGFLLSTIFQRKLSRHNNKHNHILHHVPRGTSFILLSSTAPLTLQNNAKRDQIFSLTLDFLLVIMK